MTETLVPVNEQLQTSPGVSLVVRSLLKSPVPRLQRRTHPGYVAPGAADEPGDILRQDIQNLARGFAARQSLRVGWKHGKISVPPIGQFAPLHQLDLGRQLRELVSIS